MYSVAEIADKIGAEILGDENGSVARPVSLSTKNAGKDVIMWCKKGSEFLLTEINEGVIICEEVEQDFFQAGCTYLIVPNARQAFKTMLLHFFQPKKPSRIESSAIIGENVSFGKDPYVGHHVVIEDNSIVGDHVYIDHGTIIKSGTVIGNHVSIGSNTSIGGDGFGFEKNLQSDYEIIPHLGNVVIEDHVEIGNNVVIDRAVLDSTRIGSYSKIDNLVYIAHGVTIGRNCLVIGCSMISGSTKLDDNVWVSPNATLINKIKIGAGALIGIGAVVLNDTPANTVVAGNPARTISIAKEKLKT